MPIIKTLCIIALVGSLAAADQTGTGVGSGDANAAATGTGKAGTAGGKAGTETGTGKGTENEQPAAKAPATGDGNRPAGAAGTEVQLAALPADVRSAVTREASTQEISSIHKRSDAGKTVYDVEVNRAGKNETIHFDQNGQKVDRSGAARTGTNKAQ